MPQKSLLYTYANLLLDLNFYYYRGNQKLRTSIDIQSAFKT